MERFEEVKKEEVKKEEVKKEMNMNDVKSISLFFMFIFIITLIWFITGAVGFIMSLVCCFYNGSTADKFLGILLAWVLGPFYWLYFIYNSSYCTRFNPVNPQPYYE
jgi:peptidoglycan biosynthesis protein MviN/MurJ (putative lipid II flippase)